MYIHIQCIYTYIYIPIHNLMHQWKCSEFHVGFFSILFFLLLLFLILRHLHNFILHTVKNGCEIVKMVKNFKLLKMLQWKPVTWLTESFFTILPNNKLTFPESRILWIFFFLQCSPEGQKTPAVTETHTYIFNLIGSYSGSDRVDKTCQKPFLSESLV